MGVWYLLFHQFAELVDPVGHSLQSGPPEFLIRQIDARNLGTMVTRKLRELTDGEDGDILRIANTYKQFVEGTLTDEQISPAMNKIFKNLLLQYCIFWQNS